MELHQIIYGLLAAQIEFGTYRYKDPLPKMEEVSQWFSVSLGTVKTNVDPKKRTPRDKALIIW
ncbi:hypothetical protein NIA71_13400 [Ihubacter massiliensis]|uniref:HTH gntR-type domain-containing protein n=1 Tax=Hominibacterium faecale TaxID=2839743 RepID=A0A9J6QJB4_9FIRM|nr:MULTISPECIES: hypothetical protein [Eubacteriales Family XIII. Incertae Sedis]MCO7122940.1 hypothetical protein [Ihubacter massiliensis]MCU7377201.1 hypothetical protein [Hominibacterium faecale]MDE8731569.1 hypothetical protein [Eubacteriales bacterium DFI.9.88]